MQHFVKLLKYLSVSVIQLIIGFVSIPIITHLMSPSEMGTYGIMMSVVVIMIPLSSLCADSYFPVAKSKRDNFPDIKKTTYIFSSVIFLVFLSVITMYSFFNNMSTLLLFLPFYCWIRALRISQQAELVYDEKVSIYGMSNILLSLLTLIFCVGALSYVRNDAYARLIASIFPEIMILIFCFKCVEPIKHARFDKDELKVAIRYALPLILSLFPAWIINEYGRIFLSNKGTLAMVGVLTVSMQIAAFQLQINAAVNNAFITYIYKNINNLYNVKFLLCFSGTLLITTLVGTLFVYWFGDKLISKEYVGFISITMIAMFGVFFQSLASLPSLYASHLEKTSWRLLSLSFAAAVSVFLLVFFVESKTAVTQVVYIYSVSMFLYFVFFMSITYAHYIKNNNY